MSERPLRLPSAAVAVAALALLAACPGKDREPCPAGQTRCSGACVDLQTSLSDCGACGHACPVSGSCTAGTCACPATLPDACTGPGGIGGACVDLQTGDGGSCGTCGLSCQGSGVSGLDVACTSGTCVCAGTATSKDCGTNPRCVNTLVDESNCGACGTTCDVARHWTCDAGTCQCIGSYGTQCGTACVNVLTDASNCGSCSHVCSLAREVCADGGCQCPSAFPIACPAVSPTQCVNTTSDEQNCGGCGLVCPASATCTASHCVCPGTSTVACGSTCCGGTQCCGPGTECQAAHQNGVGGTYYLGCTALLGPADTTHDAALAAADSWRSGTGTATYDGIESGCGPYCLARRTQTQCAVWCWAGATYPGKVRLDSIGTECQCPSSTAGTTWN